MTNTRCLSIWTSLLLLVALVPASARSGTADASRRFQTGLELLHRGKPRLALRMFREANSLSPQPVFRIYVGIARIELGESQPGAETILRALPDSPLRDTKLRARLVELAGKLCALPETRRPLSTFLILQRLRGSAHVACLLKAAKESRDPAQRIAAIDALGALRSASAIDELEKVFRASKSLAVQEAVVRVVASYRTRQAVILFKEWAETAGLKYWAILGLARLGHADALTNWDWLIKRAPLGLDEVSTLLAILGLKQKAALVALYALEQTTQRKHPSRARWLDRLRRFLPGVADQRKKWHKSFERAFSSSPNKGLETLKQRHPAPTLTLFSVAPDRFSGIALANGFSWVERGKRLLKLDRNGRARFKKEIGQTLHTLRAFGDQLLASNGTGLVLFDTHGKQTRSLAGLRLITTHGKEIFALNGEGLLRIDAHSRTAKLPVPKLENVSVHAGDGVIYVSGRSSAGWNLFCLKRSDLRLLWQRQLPVAEGDRSARVTPLSREVTTLAIGGLRSRIYGITANTGVTRWLYRLPELQGRDVTLGRPVVSNGGNLIVPAESIYALTPEGNLAWRSAPFGARLVAACANGTILASDGTHLWLLDENGSIRTVFRSFENGKGRFTQIAVGDGEVFLAGTKEIRVFRINGVAAARTPVAFARDPL